MPYRPYAMKPQMGFCRAYVENICYIYPITKLIEKVHYTEKSSPNQTRKSTNSPLIDLVHENEFHFGAKPIGKGDYYSESNSPLMTLSVGVNVIR